jgi:hypothetical protein
VDVVGLASGVTAITAGYGHTCALTSNGGIKCWGYKRQGQLGDGTTNWSNTPVDVVGLSRGVTAVTAGTFHTCALAGAGRAKCWGWDSMGQLGLGTITHRLTPVDVVESVPPSLNISYATGQPGSLFTISGWIFPPGAQAALIINGQQITTTLTVNPTGSFIFFLETSQAEPGGYAVTVNVNPSDGILSLDNGDAVTTSLIVSASTSFFLADDAPLRPQEGGGQTFSVPADSALHNFVYLTLVTR